jgi:hypothetical protein
LEPERGVEVAVLQVPVSEVPAALLSTMMLSGEIWLALCRW